MGNILPINKQLNNINKQQKHVTNIPSTLSHTRPCVTNHYQKTTLHRRTKKMKKSEPMLYSCANTNKINRVRLGEIPKMIPPNTVQNNKLSIHLSIPCFIFFLLSLPQKTLSIQSCPTRYCDGDGSLRPPIRFPFSAGSYNHSRRCGYPGFHLHCSKRTHQPVISLPSSGNFTVQVIDYTNQLIWMSDPDRCLPKRILTLDLTRSPFYAADIRNYTFLNCTEGNPGTLARSAAAVTCLSEINYTVFVTFRESTVEFLAESGRCRVIKSVMSPIMWPVYRDESGSDLGTAFIPLSWDAPNCGECERVGGVCGFLHHSALDVGCSISIAGKPSFPLIRKNGAPKIVRYGLIIGLGIPAFIFMVALTFYFSGKIRSYNQRRSQLANTEFSPSIFPQPAVVIVGLDGHTIESYPKTLLGESGRLPNPSSVICSICLSDYEAKETLRTIPECNHYFHAQCIDEWLRLKGTCPLCRNSPGK